MEMTFSKMHPAWPQRHASFIGKSDSLFFQWKLYFLLHSLKKSLLFLVPSIQSLL